MKILLNASNLVKGGALQACINFITEAIKDGDIDWVFVISDEMAFQLTASGLDINNKVFIPVSVSPSKSLKSRKLLLALEGKEMPDAVFTFFGPAYVQFNAIHFMGFADPWVTHPNHFALKCRSTLTKIIKNSAVVWYKKLWLKYADYWIVEAKVAKEGIIRLENVDEERVGVVPNSCRDDFRSIKSKSCIYGKDDTLKILYISAYYMHKNFEIIPYVAKELKLLSPELSFIFILTLSGDLPESKIIIKKAKELRVLEHIEFRGKVSVSDAVLLYEECQLSFVPTLLETFSATIPEAMAAGLPIVATDFDFSKNVGGNAVKYFPADRPDIAAKYIVNIRDDAELRQNMIKRGKEIVNQLPNAKEKYILYKNFILGNL